MKDIYFAHPKLHYNTDIEMKSLNALANMLTFTGLEIQDMRILNPNQDWLGKIYEERKAKGDPVPFEIFREVARSCDIVVGVTFLDGVLGSGVAEEMRTAIDNNQDTYILYLSNEEVIFKKVTSLQEEYHVLTINETRERNEQGVM